MARNSGTGVRIPTHILAQTMGARARSHPSLSFISSPVKGKGNMTTTQSHAWHGTQLLNTSCNCTFLLSPPSSKHPDKQQIFLTLNEIRKGLNFLLSPIPTTMHAYAWGRPLVQTYSLFEEEWRKERKPTNKKSVQDVPGDRNVCTSTGGSLGVTWPNNESFCCFFLQNPQMDYTKMKQYLPYVSF